MGVGHLPPLYNYIMFRIAKIMNVVSLKGDTV